MSFDDCRRLARLFLVELDGPTRDTLAKDDRFRSSLPSNLQDARVEFARLFTLSVYPYASVFLEDEPVLHGESTANVERWYERVGFELEREWVVAAPDALGAEMACLGWLHERGDETVALEFLRDFILPWAPVCCLALERAAQLPLYRTLAQVTRAALLGEGERLHRVERLGQEWTEPGLEERDLHWVIDYIVSPARSGIFLGKEDLSEIAAQVDVPISFGDRRLMLASLLRGAGFQGRIPEALKSLQALVHNWTGQYAAWKVHYPHSAGLWRRWLARTEETQRLLGEMHQDAEQLRAEEG